MGATASSLVCVSESTPVYFAFLPFAVLPRRFTVPWFVHAWCLLPATTAALTIRARQERRHHNWNPPEGREGGGEQSFRLDVEDAQARTLSHVLAEIRLVSGESFVFVLKKDPVIDLLRIKKKF